MRYFPVLFLFFLTIPAVTKAISVRSLVKQSIGLLPEKMRFQTHSAVRACAIRILGHSFVGEIPKKQMRKWFASDSPIIIEAGGHLGSDTREFKQLWPESTVYTFEPVPDLYAELLKNTGGLSGVYPFPFALGPQAGIQKIHVSKGGFNGSSSLLRPKIHKTAFPEVTFPTQINVTVVNLEKWAEEHRVGGVDLIWLDLQGYEYEALRNATGLLARTRVLFSEVNLVETYEGALLYPEYRRWLEAQGFEIVEEVFPNEFQGNVLAVNWRFFTP